MNRFTRRELLKLGVMGGAGLALGLRSGAGWPETTAGAAHELIPLVHIGTDGKIILFAQNPELGQGVKTSLPMILAEELDVRLAEVSIRQADWMPGTDLQFSGGSLSIRLNYRAMRQAGAAARQMLLQAAAQRWNLLPDELLTRNGAVSDATGSLSATYGELAREASGLPVPDDPPLKSAADFHTIGRSHRDVDLEAILQGKPLFSSDHVLPGMLYAVVRRSPVGDGQVTSYSEAGALAIPGVRAVHVLSNTKHGGRVVLPNSPNFVSGVAVLADTTWSAMQGAAALEVTWSNPGMLENTKTLYEQFHAGLERDAVQIRRDGDPDTVIAKDPKTFEAVYQVPLLAHVPMEPMNCTARWADGKIELWAPTQNPGGVAQAVAAAMDIDASDVIVHVVRSGGAFGRRYFSDFAIDAAVLSRKSGRAIKVVWPRQDDVRHDYFRPAGVHRIRAALDSENRITAWHHKLAGHSREAFLEREDPAWTSELYEHVFPAGFVPNLLLEHVFIPSRIPLGQWRAIAATANVFVVGSAVDELAHRAGEDPLEFLLRLVGKEDSVRIIERFALDTKRLRGVINKAAAKAGWKQPLGWEDDNGRHGRGIAASYDQGAWVAEVAEVTLSNGRLTVDRVVAAVDCGPVINPQGAETQVQGAIMEGLSAALTGEITVQDGVVEQSNFHDYPFLRMGQAPDIEVHFMDSGGDPRGLGEPPLPVLAPAVCNAIFAATGKRIRLLPLKHHFEV